MIIDFHTHLFPPRILDKAMEILIEGSGVTPCIEATKEGLLHYMETENIDVSVALPVASRPDQEHSINSFAIEINSPQVLSFGSVHPDSKDALSELIRIKEAGLKGIKLHPDNQDFFVDEPRLFPIYEKCAELGLIVLFHAGVDFTVFEPVHCPPEKLAKILPIFGGSPVVAAHFGGYLMWDEVERHLVGKDIYFDTSFSYATLPKKQARRIIDNHGADKILLGSDIPWSNTHDEVLFIRRLHLDDKREAMILAENALSLLALDKPAI